ncbi:MAG: response regulator [Alphaproteobacteria bacterium]|nr:response regulator [Alphaproteobacteria bacterium]
MATILTVDDDPAIREALTEALTDLGNPACAAEGKAAPSWLEQHRADAVLLDMRMPGPDGMKVLQRIRAKPSAPPVVVLSGRAHQPQYDRSDAAGCRRSPREPDRAGGSEGAPRPHSVGRGGNPHAACGGVRTRRADRLQYADAGGAKDGRAARRQVAGTQINTIT